MTCPKSLSLTKALPSKPSVHIAPTAFFCIAEDFKNFSRLGTEEDHTTKNEENDHYPRKTVGLLRLNKQKKNETCKWVATNLTLQTKASKAALFHST